MTILNTLPSLDFRDTGMLNGYRETYNRDLMNEIERIMVNGYTAFSHPHPVFFPLMQWSLCHPMTKTTRALIQNGIKMEDEQMEKQGFALVSDYLNRYGFMDRCVVDSLEQFFDRFGQMLDAEDDDYVVTFHHVGKNEAGSHFEWGDCFYMGEKEISEDSFNEEEGFQQVTIVEIYGVQKP